MACNEMQINIFIDAVNIDAARARGGGGGGGGGGKGGLAVATETRGQRDGARIYFPGPGGV